MKRIDREAPVSLYVFCLMGFEQIMDNNTGIVATFVTTSCLHQYNLQNIYASKVENDMS
jgi:hypothetical protein